MISRRQESFRYTFNKPINCAFIIKKIDEIVIDSDFAIGHIIDISPGGLKMTTPLNFSPTQKKVEIEVHFSLNDRSFQIPGQLLWQKKEFQKNGFSYGVKLDSTAEVASKIIDGLKVHAENSIKGKKFK